MPLTHPPLQVEDTTPALVKFSVSMPALVKFSEWLFDCKIGVWEVLQESLGSFFLSSPINAVSPNAHLTPKFGSDQMNKDGHQPKMHSDVLCQSGDRVPHGVRAFFLQGVYMHAFTQNTKK